MTTTEYSNILSMYKVYSMLKTHDKAKKKQFTCNAALKFAKILLNCFTSKPVYFKYQVMLLNVFTSTSTDTDTWKHSTMCT